MKPVLPKSPSAKKKSTDHILDNIDKSPKIGRRTQTNVIPVGKVVRKKPDGTDNFADYWTDHESRELDERSDDSYLFEESLNDNPKIGRRTGLSIIPVGKTIRRKSDGKQNFADYWTDAESESDEVNHLSPTVSTTNDPSERMSVDRNRPSPLRQQIRTSNRGSFNERVSNSHSPSASKALSSNNNSHNNSLLTNETPPPETSDRDTSIDRSHSTQTRNSDNLLLAENDTSINVSMKNVSESGEKTKFRSRSHSISDEESTSALPSDDRPRTSVRKRKASASQTYLSDPETSPPASKKNSSSLRTTRQHSQSQINEELSNTLNSKSTYVEERHNKVKQLSKKLGRKGNTSKHKEDYVQEEFDGSSRSAASAILEDSTRPIDHVLSEDQMNSLSKPSSIMKTSSADNNKRQNTSNQLNTPEMSSKMRKSVSFVQNMENHRQIVTRNTSKTNISIHSEDSENDLHLGIRADSGNSTKHYTSNLSMSNSISRKSSEDRRKSSFVQNLSPRLQKDFPKKPSRKKSSVYSNASEDHEQTDRNDNDKSSAVEKTRLTHKTIHSGKSNLKRKASANTETISNQVSDEDDNVQPEPYNSSSSFTHTRNRKDFPKKTSRKKISVYSTDREGHEQTGRNTNEKSSAVEKTHLTHKKNHSGKSNFKGKASVNSEIISSEVSDEDDNIQFDPDKSLHSPIVEKGRIDMTSSSFTHTTNRKYFPKKTTKKTTAIYSDDSEGDRQTAENQNKKSSAKKRDNLTHKEKTSGKSKYLKGKAPVNNEHITVNQVPDVDDNAQFDPDNSHHSLPMEKSQIDMTPSSSVPHTTNRKSSSFNKRLISAHQNDVSVVPTLSSPQHTLNLASTSKSAKNAKPDKRKRRQKNSVIPSSPIKRSSRTRMKPLAFWAGERIRQRLVSGNVCSEYLQKQWEDTYDKIKETPKNTKAKRRNISSKATKQMSTQKIFKVICDDKGSEEEAEVLFLYQQVSSTLNPVFNQNQSSPSYFITKTFGNGDLSSGYIKVKTQKSEQVSPDHNIFYVVLQGKVSVRINQSEIVASFKDSFIIPKHNGYSISNLSNNPSLLHYSTVRQPIFDFQENIIK